MPEGPDAFSHMSSEELHQAISNMEGDIAVEVDADVEMDKSGSQGSIAHVKRLGLSRDVGPIYARLDKARAELKARKGTEFDPSLASESELDRETIDDVGSTNVTSKGPLLALGAGLVAAAMVIGLAVGHVGPFAKTATGSQASGAGGASASASSPSAAPVANRLTVDGVTALTGTVTYSDVKCYTPGYGGHEIDALLTVGSKHIGIAILDSGAPLGLSPKGSYVAIHLDLAAPPTDPSGWLSAAKTATFKDATFKSVNIDGPLFKGTTPEPGSTPVGKTENMHIACAE